ncbi:MAG: transcriptional regulator, LysR family [Mycobacterium sp.]|nr:transcriptional regulator, LysR family [Mycobacterium sp.]
MHERTQWQSALSLSPNLVYLALIVEHGSFAAAAARLQMTPSTLSRAVRRLEHELHLELAVRDGRAITLTTAGEVLANHARLAVEQMRQGLNEASQAGGRPVIRVGLLQSLGADYVPAVVSDFLADHPDVQFFFREESGYRLEQMLVDGEIDLALIAPPPDNDALVSAVLFPQHIDVVVAQDSVLARRSTVDLRELEQENFILTESGYGIRDVVDALFRTAGYEPKVIMETTNLAMAAALAAAKIGVALGPPMPDGITGVVRIPVADETARRDVAICTRKSTAPSPHLDAFVEHVRTHPAGTASGARR